MTTTAVLLFHPHLDASRVNARLAQAARSAGTPEHPVQVRDLYALYPDLRIDVDAEHALDVKYASNLGVDTDNLYVSQPDFGHAPG